MSSMVQSSVASLARNALRQKLLTVALSSSEFKSALSEAAAEIRGLAKPDATEATIEGCFERIMYAQLREIGLKFHPEKESGVDLRRHVTRGRMDSRLGALVIEYKRPSLLKTDGQIKKALRQLKEYLIALSEQSEVPFVGFLTNGLVVVEVRAINGVVVQESAVERLSRSTLLRLTQQFISLALTALTSTNLIRDFCGSETDGVLFHTARLLNGVLATNPQPKTAMLHSEWAEMFRLAHDDQSQQKRIEERRVALAELFAVGIDDATAEYRALFALHTAYAILLKFIAYRVVSDVYFGEVGQDYRSLARSSPAALRAFCDSLEDGEVFRHLGIVNLLEGDFFSWYCDKKQWTPALADSIREILAILARYEEARRIFESDEAPDLFRDLYQAAVPRVVRSSFGEFYTPYWLAEHVLESAAPKKRWRAIDPCCGSGTFVITAIAKLRRECDGYSSREMLKEIVSRVTAVDLNPLSVLTTRIHYFIHVSDLLHGPKRDLVIPVYLGDAAAVPDRILLDGVKCLRFELKTLKTPINTVLPVSLVEDTPRFMQIMLRYERSIKAEDIAEAISHLMRGVTATDRTPTVRKAITTLTEELIDLERNGWNGIWARILSNFFTTACLGRFSVVVGNPPWIDWKNLPAGYRERVKSLCIDRGLFSGAGRTGGINLNICALIAYVSMTNWLDRSGRLAFLMPRELANQASYEGWRRLGGKWKFLEFHNWSKAGHPFDPVKEDFMTFVIGSGQRSTGSIPVIHFRKKPGSKSKAATWKNAKVAGGHLQTSDDIAGQVIPGSTALTFARDQTELDEFSLVAGECEYIGREGIQFYPQELQVFRYISRGPRPGTAWLNNIQVRKARYRLPRRRILLETKYLHPLVTAPAIKPFQHNYDGLLVAFPYDSTTPTKPTPPSVLKRTAPLLLAYYEKHREMIESLSAFNVKIRGPDPGAFYGVARTGPYSFAETYVAFRKDTQWCAVVVSSQRVPWGGENRLVFQSHAASICERRGSGIITEDEAHYVCAIFNTPIVERFIEASSDNRSFKIRPPVYVPLYNPSDKRHARLVAASREAHTNPGRLDAVRATTDRTYLEICRDREELGGLSDEDASDAKVAQQRLAEIKKNRKLLIGGDALRAELDNLLS